MTRQGFRRLIILQWLLGLSAVVASWLTLPPDLKGYLEAKPNAEPTIETWIIFAAGVLILIASIIIYVGLYRFRPWAKTLLWPIHLAALLMMPFYGPSILSGWANALSYLYALVNGGILFLVYLSPLGQMFRNDSDV
jgi:ABC-type arginine/histidine transport system permease subunit